MATEEKFEPAPAVLVRELAAEMKAPVSDSRKLLKEMGITVPMWGQVEAPVADEVRRLLPERQAKWQAEWN